MSGGWLEISGETCWKLALYICLVFQHRTIVSLLSVGVSRFLFASFDPSDGDGLLSLFTPFSLSPLLSAAVLAVFVVSGSRSMA